MGSVAQEQAADALAGQLVGGRYRLHRKIGKGGMGVVYEAEHVGLDKRVAVKFLLDRFTDDPEVVERFHREARTASRIGQDHIIDVTDVGSDDGRPYIVMELLEGQDLGHVLADSGPMPAQRAVKVVRQILRGLDAAHGKGIVHRDMKPENVFVVQKGSDPDFVKIMDFGISKILAANESKVRLTATGAVIGTPVYMAPEQALAQAELDHRVDIYAVGVMLFELLAGRPPFLANNYLGLVTQHLNAPPPSLATFRPDVPAALVAAVAKALEKDPAKRFQTAAEMARALPPETMLREMDTASTMNDADGVRMATDGAIAARPFGMTPASERAEPAEPKKRRGIWLVGVALVLAVGMVVVAVATKGKSSTSPSPSTSTSTKPESETEATKPSTEPEVVSLGKLDVRTAGARVYVDDTYKGSSPILIAGVPDGAHDLRLEHDGFQTLSTSVYVTGGKSTVVEDALVPLKVERPAIVKPKVDRPEPKVAKPEPKVAKPEPKIEKPGTDEPKIDKPKVDKPKTGRPGEKPNPYDD
jgi:serine/threonine protein kinase